MTIFIIVLISAYFMLIGSFVVGFFRIKEFKLNKIPSLNGFSILIPFRNESKNLPELLKSLSNLNYPKELFEIILINDASDDDYMPILNKYIDKNEINIRLINNKRNSNSPKKDALETGIDHSNFNWIITTDADCTFSEFWLNSYDEFIQMNDVVFIAGPVTFTKTKSFLDKFQLLDFTALIGCSIGGFGINRPFMCNGANLCYNKNAFETVHGFKGNKNIASGDDIFLLEKMIKTFPNQTKYLKSTHALVTTSTMPTIKDLFSQRIRWASKTTSYTNTFTKLVSLIVLLINLVSALITTKLILFQEIPSYMLIVLFLKIGIDFIIILITLKFKKRTVEIILFPLISLLHPFFNISIAILSFFKQKYYWKNRSIKTNG